MTTMETAATSADAAAEPRSEEAERQVSARVLTALLRENYAGLAERVEPGHEVAGVRSESLAQLMLAGNVISGRARRSPWRVARIAPSGTAAGQRPRGAR